MQSLDSASGAFPQRFHNAPVPTRHVGERCYGCDEVRCDLDLVVGGPPARAHLVLPFSADHCIATGISPLQSVSLGYNIMLSRI